MGLFRRRDEPDLSDLSDARAPTSTESGTVWCHSCGGEFRSGTSSVCFDCGAPLSFDPPKGWEPADVEAAGDPEPEVEYDLGDWAGSSRRALGERLDRLDVPHTWADDVLVVLASDERRVDRLVEDVQAGSEDVLDGLEPLALPDGVPCTEHDLAEWSEARRREVHRRLCFATVPFELGDDGLLVTPTSDDQLVTHVLDAVEFPDALPEADEDDVHLDDLPPAIEVLGGLYVACDVLKGNCHDATAIRDAIAGVEDLVELRVPYGYEDAAWKRIVDEADVLWELLVDGGEPDDVEESARRLRDLLHPLV